jgi:hypothetical protein
MTRPSRVSPTATSMTGPCVRPRRLLAASVVAEQDDADVVLVHVEGNAEHPPGNFTNSSKPTPGRPETLAMPVETLVMVPTSRGGQLRL